MNPPETAAATSTQVAEAPAVPNHYLNHSKGFLSWALTLDHKRIGLMYLVGVLGCFALGGIFALLVRTELWAPGDTIAGMFASPGSSPQEVYNMWFTVHGAVMVFLVIIPGVPAALGNFVLPIMLGAKDVAFPRLNLGSFYLWVIGALFFVYTLFNGGVDGGWTFYTPYSASQATNVIPALLGVFILGFSSIFTGTNFVVTIHKLRPPGMTWFRMPLFLWGSYATALIQVLATPVLGITLLLLIMEKTLHVGIFSPEYGGDPVLYKHFFWFYSHPAVYIMILPAMGIVSELISVHSHKRPFGYQFIAYSSIAIAVFGFLVWGHHMFTSTQSPAMNAIFSAITFSVSIPSAIKVFNWLATMWGGSIRLTVPMLYGLAFIFLFSIGGLTGLYLGTLSTDIHFHDTYFVVAHFHYVMMGSALIGMFGGVHHWWPKMVGRHYNGTLARISWALIFVGFNVTFFTQFLLGSQGMPRRYYDYLPRYEIYHKISTVGSYMMAAGFLIMAFYLLQSIFGGRKSPANPWGANTLEWHCTSPPPHDNFATAPAIEDCYDYSGIDYDAKIGGYTSRANP